MLHYMPMCTFLGVSVRSHSCSAICEFLIRVCLSQTAEDADMLVFVRLVAALDWQKKESISSSPFPRDSIRELGRSREKAGSCCPVGQVEVFPFNPSPFFPLCDPRSCDHDRSFH